MRPPIRIAGGQRDDGADPREAHQLRPEAVGDLLRR